MGRKLSKLPSVVQLPGGVRLSGIPFRIVARDEQDRPLMFQILPEGETGDCALYADAEWIRKGT